MKPILRHNPQLQPLPGRVEIGTFICHARFGNGTVTAIEDTGDNCKITVEFENVGRKQLLLKFAKFTIIE